VTRPPLRQKAGLGDRCGTCLEGSLGPRGKSERVFGVLAEPVGVRAPHQIVYAVQVGRLTTEL